MMAKSVDISQFIRLWSIAKSNKLAPQKELKKNEQESCCLGKMAAAEITAAESAPPTR